MTNDSFQIVVEKKVPESPPLWCGQVGQFRHKNSKQDSSCSHGCTYHQSLVLHLKKYHKFNRKFRQFPHFSGFSAFAHHCSPLS